MTDDGIPDGVFPRERPMQQSCESRDDHPEHLDSEVQELYGGRRERWWTRCPGWTTTHTVTVTDMSGRIVGTENVDLRGHDEYNGSTNEVLLTMTYEAREAGEVLTPDALAFGTAAYAVAPLICPFDSDRCHEHLYGLAEDLEDA